MDFDVNHIVHLPDYPAVADLVAQAVAERGMVVAVGEPMVVAAVVVVGGEPLVVLVGEPVVVVVAVV